MGPVTLVLDVRIAYDRWGSSSKPSLNSQLHYPTDIDRPLKSLIPTTPIYMYSLCLSLYLFIINKEQALTTRRGYPQHMGFVDDPCQHPSSSVQFEPMNIQSESTRKRKKLILTRRFRRTTRVPNSPVYVIYYILHTGSFAAACSRPSRTVVPILDDLDRHVLCSSFDNPST